MKLNFRKLTGLEWMLVVTTLLEFNPLFQAVKSATKGSVQDVSPWTFLSILVIGGLWFTYGLKIKNVPLVLGNAIKLFSSACVLCIYLYLTYWK